MYSYEFCGKDAHYGHDCPPQILLILQTGTAFCNNDDDDDDDEEYTIAITPVLPTVKPDNSLSMRDEHLSTIPEKEESRVEDLVSIPRSGYHQKDRKPSQNDKTEHGMEKTVQNQGQSPKMSKSESILKNTIECNLYPSDGPGKPNSISMKTVKTLKAQS
ncbi:hypothetical protein Tco_1443493 [Tanacetum coccineum]